MAARRTTRLRAEAPRRGGSCPFAASVPLPPSAPPTPGTLVDRATRDRAALAAVLDPIITIDARGFIQFASDSVRRVLGWRSEDLLGRNVSVLMPEPHHSAHDVYLANYQRTGRTNIMNRPRRFEARHKDGSAVPVELCVSRADMPAGGTPLFVGIIRDMRAYAATERSQDEEMVRSQQLLAEQTAALQQAHLQLRMADRMASIGTLAAGLGHDMNNVLMPVRARLEALKASVNAGTIPASERKHIEEVRKSVAYLQQLADGLHFLAMDPDTDEDARAGGVATDLHQWWAQTGALLSKAVPKHVRVTASFPARLPLVGLAAHGLTQAILNLVVNAGEAIPGPKDRKRKQGSVRVWAKSVDEEGQPWVRLGVTDNGLGMPEEVQRRAFEMFFTTKPRGLGTGLGLALVRKAVTRGGGRVEIDSVMGKGTTVSLIIPAVRAAGPSRAATTAPTVVITLRDGRAAALIRHVLESSGAKVRLDRKPTDAHMWVIDPSHTAPSVARAWRKDHPRGSLVLLGTPSPARAAAWRPLLPIIIERPDDFDAVRAALGKAMTPV